MELRCPNCGVKFPWRWRVAELFYRRSGGYYSKCPSCKNWVRIKAEHEKSQKQLMSVLLFLTLPLVIIADDIMRGGRIIKKSGFYFLMNADPNTLYLFALTIIGLVLWLDQRKADYAVQLSKPNIKKKRASFLLAFVMLTSMMIWVNVLGVFIYLKYNEWRFLTAIALLTLVFIIWVKMEREKLRELERESAG